MYRFSGFCLSDNFVRKVSRPVYIFLNGFCMLDPDINFRRALGAYCPYLTLEDISVDYLM
jgi:hypothetical protein